MESGFTRQEVLALCELSSSQLSYFDRTELVVPRKIGNPKRPTVIYTWQQVLELRTLVKLREQISLQEIRKVIDYLKESDFGPSLFDKVLLFWNKQLCWVTRGELGNQIITLSKGNCGQTVFQLLVDMADIVQGLWDCADRSNVLDFEKRAGKIQRPQSQAA